MSFLGNDTLGAGQASALLLQSSCIIEKGKRATINLLGDGVCPCSVVGSVAASQAGWPGVSLTQLPQGPHLLQLLTSKLPASLPHIGQFHLGLNFGFQMLVMFKNYLGGLLKCRFLDPTPRWSDLGAETCLVPWRPDLGPSEWPLHRPALFSLRIQKHKRLLYYRDWRGSLRAGRLFHSSAQIVLGTSACRKLRRESGFRLCCVQRPREVRWSHLIFHVPAKVMMRICRVSVVRGRQIAAPHTAVLSHGSGFWRGSLQLYLYL